MGGSFKIGRFSGIDVKVHWTFLLLLAFFAFIGYQSSGTLAGALTPIFFGVGLLLGPLPRKTDATAMTVEKTRP